MGRKKKRRDSVKLTAYKRFKKSRKAIPSDQLTETDTVFDFKTAAKKADDDFELDPANATQIICGDRVYQVTSETVSKEQLGNYLDILAEKVVFDADTKMPLTKEELNKIDWTGVSGVQTRESWFYVDVYEISGTDASEAVAVKVNNNYYVARAL